MNVKRLASAALVLGCVSAYAKAPEAKAPVSQSPDREVWITLDSGAVGYVNAALMGEGLAVPARVSEKGAVTALRLPESQLGLVSKVMHNQFHRCGGFVYHGTESEALAAVNAPEVAAPPSLAANYTLDNPTLVNSMLAGLQAQNILDTIGMLSAFPTRSNTTQSGVDAANALRTKWLGFIPAGRTGVTVELRPHANWIQPSVIATIEGSTFPDEIVVIGGHLDSINLGSGNAPGADDDASGVATFSEVLRVALAQGYRPAKTVKFMAYAAEEVGLRGSSEIAQEYRNANRNVIGVLQLDMTNYKAPTSPVDVGIITDRTSAAQNTFITNLIGAYAPDITWGNSSCGYACSDHASWTTAGFPASIPFEGLMSGSNPVIHSAQDTLSRSDSTGAHALKFARIATAYMAELAEGTLTVSDNTPPEVALTSPTSGATVTGSVSITATATDASGISRVEFLVDGVVRSTDNVSPYSFSWDTGAASNGAHTLEARAYDTVNNPQTSAPVAVTVNNPTSVAGYDPTLKAPRCFSVSESCDSGALLNGRGSMGPELNFPNTINNSCADGLSGTYRSDESNERIKVSTVDGTPFAPGKTVRIEASVWVYSTTPDKLDLYYTGNANVPSPTFPAWTFIATLRPTAKGAQTLSTTYTLPAGTVQAVRARYRYNGSASACGTGSYNDHDDLIFAVQP
ncbi:M20/M25/M40 family metallo-hydrolase [Pyxidicoccus sp. 3LG]